MKDICLIERLEDWDKIPVVLFETDLYAEVEGKWQRIKWLDNIKFINQDKFKFGCKLYEDDFINDHIFDNYNCTDFMVSNQLARFDGLFEQIKETKLRLCFADDRNLIKGDLKVYREMKEFIFRPEFIEKYYDKKSFVWMQDVYGKIGSQLIDITNESL